MLIEDLFLGELEGLPVGHDVFFGLKNCSLLDFKSHWATPFFRAVWLHEGHACPQRENLEVSEITRLDFCIYTNLCCLAMVQAVSFQGVEYCRPGKIFMLGRLFFLEGDDEVIIKLFKKIVGLQLGKCIRQGFR